MRCKTLATPENPLNTRILEEIWSGRHSPSVIVFSSLSIIFFEKHQPKQQIISAAPAPSQTAFRAFVRQPPHVIQNILHSLDLVLGCLQSFVLFRDLSSSSLHILASDIKTTMENHSKCPKHLKRPSSTLCLKFQAQLCFQWWHFLLRTSIWILTI